MALVSPAPSLGENGNGVIPDSNQNSEQNESAVDVSLDGEKPILKTTGTVAYNVTYFKDF